MSRPRWVVLTAILIAAIAGSIGLLTRHAAQGLEHATIDWRYELRGTRSPPKDIMIVALDTKTGLELNLRLPPPRDLQARVVRRLIRAGAKVIGYDLALNGVTDPGSDLAIVHALQKAGKAVVSVTRYDRYGDTDLLAGIVPFAETRVVPGNTERLGSSSRTWISFSPAVGRLDSFALAVAAAFRGVRRIPLPSGALIDFRGPSGTFPRLSFVDVLNGRFDRAAVRGKIVLVGTAAPELQDLHDVPVGDRMLGVELQANAIATALQAFPLRATTRTVSTVTTLLMGAVVPLSLLVAALLLRWRDRGFPSSLTVLSAGVVAAGVWCVLAQVEFNDGTVVNFTPGFAATLTATATSWGLATVLERRRYAALRRRFAGGDPDLIERVISAKEDDNDYGRLRRIVPGFEIEALMGHGGMGVVYRATELALDRRIALKVIRDEFADRQEYRTRFLREAKRGAAIEHSNLVPVYSVGQSGEQLWIVMRLIDGDNLERVLRERGRLELPEAARLIYRVALALDALHEGRVIHCDVKPANILRADADPEHPYLTDFGIARPLDAAQARAERRAGTPSYMAPEQISDENVGPATDIYALGAVLFHCLTGTEPFAGDVDDVLYAHATAPRPRVSERVPGLPEALDALIQRAMAVQPDERFDTAVAFAQAVLDVSRDQTVGPAVAPGAPQAGARSTESL